MSRIISKPMCQNILFFVAILAVFIGLILFPSESVAAAKDGVILCLNVIVPSLFPFFVLSSMCVNSGMISALGRMLNPVMYPLFRVNGNCAGAFLLGIIGGYPVGARTAISLYETGQCSKSEAERMLSFCNNSGPAFILGVVGAGIFSSSTVGLWLYGAHVLASIFVGILFRSYGDKTKPNPKSTAAAIPHISFAEVFTESVKNAFSAVLNISSFVIFFTVIIRLLYLSGIIRLLSVLIAGSMGRLGFSQTIAESLLTGLIEMTSGVWSLREAASSLGTKMCMAAFILGWAGLSVHCQVLSFLSSSDLNTRTYFLGKLLHGFFSAAIIWCIAALHGWNQSVSTYLANELTSIAHLSFTQAIAVSSCAAAFLWLILLVISPPRRQKHSGNFRQNRV